MQTAYASIQAIWVHFNASLLQNIGLRESRNYFCIFRLPRNQLGKRHIVPSYRQIQYWIKNINNWKNNFKNHVPENIRHPFLTSFNTPNIWPEVEKLFHRTFTVRKTLINFINTSHDILLLLIFFCNTLFGLGY